MRDTDPQAADRRTLFSAALDQSVAQLEASLDRLEAGRREGVLPHVTEGGRWQLRPAREGGRWDADGWHHGSWTGGFVAGALWQASRVSGAPERLEDEARAIVELLAVRAGDRSTHDVGFLFWPSAVIGYLASGERRLRDLALGAARGVAGRLTAGGFLQSWGPLDDPRAAGSSAIDTMMNLPLLWWAEREGMHEAGVAARSHARRTADAYFRDDGSTYHTVRFSEQGAPVERGTFQGYAAGSTWARGQAWAVHGFIDVFRATDERWALDLAARATETFFTRLAGSEIPPWDFDDPNPAPRDASAAAIVAAGLLKLGAVDPEAQESWRERGLDLAGRLVRRSFNHGREDGLLLDCCYSYPHREGVGGATTWGDYFLLEVLLEAVAPDRRLDLFGVPSLPGGGDDALVTATPPPLGTGAH